MKRMIVWGMMAAALLAGAAEFRVPVLWQRRSKAGEFQFAEAGFARSEGKYLIAARIGNLPELIRRDGSISVYWNSDGDKNTGRFAGSQGVDYQINASLGRESVQLIRWSDDRTRVEVAAGAEECGVSSSGDGVVIFISEKLLEKVRCGADSKITLLRAADGRKDSASFSAVAGAEGQRFITAAVPERKIPKENVTGEISVPVCWARRNASDFQVMQAGTFQDGEKYVFAFKIKNLEKLLSGKPGVGLYWNCDGDKNTGRFPGSMGVDVQFNIDLKSRRINAVMWSDAVAHRFMTVYEDDYLVEICGDVLYLALRKPALTQLKIREDSNFLFQVSGERKKADRVYFRMNPCNAGKIFIEPALNFIRFGALRSTREKKSFAAPVARKNARSTVWECGGERFSPGEATPAFSGKIPALRLKAARGETASAFFAVECAAPFAKLNILPSALNAGKKSIPADVQSVQYADYIADDRGEMFTDILLPEFPGKPVKRQFAVWHVSVPRDAAPGTYRGEIRLEIDGRPDAAIPCEVTVYSFAIPEIPALRSAFSVKNSHIAVRFKDPDICRGIYDTMVERCARFRFGPRLPGVDPKFQLDENGKLHTFWEDFDRRMKYLMDEIHVNAIQVPPGQLGSHDKFFRWNAILRKNYRSADDPEFRSVFQQYVRQYADHMKKLGIADRMLFVIWDEPYTLDEPLKGAEIVRETAPEIPIGIFIDRYDPAAAGKIDIWFVTLQVLAKTLKEAQGKRVWLYNSNGVNNFKLPASDLRSFFFLADRYGIEGFLSSEINVIGRSGVKDGVHFNHYPQHCLFYVSEDGKQVYDSWRLVLLRQGFNDYDYLALYRKLLKKAGEKVPQWLIDAEPKFDAEGMPDFKIDTTAELDRLKERIAGEIERLTGKLAL